MSTRKLGLLSAVALLIVLTLAASAFAGNGRVLANHTARFVQNTPSLGPEDSSKVISITVRLQQHNLDQRDALLKQLYTPTSPLYHQWLTANEYAAKFAPSAEESAAVVDFLKSKGLAVTYVDRNNFYVSAHGSVGDVQKAFNVSIQRFNVRGKTLYANTGNPTVNSPAAAFIASVQGLHQVQMQPHYKLPLNPDTGEPVAAVPFAAKTPQVIAGPPPSQFFENQCWRAVEAHTFTTGGKTPLSSYSGNRYGGPITGGVGHLPPCGYEPAALQIAYGVSSQINNGYDGSGQTVVIVDAFGSPTAAADFKVFSDAFGLPDSNIAVYSPQGAPPYNSGWAGETTLDIEWSHAMAPGANIALVQTIDNYDNNLQAGIQWALSNLTNIASISNSYGGPENEDDAANMDAWDSVNSEAAMMGISVDYSSGDDGDFLRATGIGYTSSVPANSPHATSIGGTSDFINADYTMKFQTGWGTDLTRLSTASTTNPAYTAPVCASTLTYTQCFYFGGGGGESTYFAKPAWQSSLPGTGRQQPDIAMDADPYTGVEIIYSYSSPGTYYVGVIGGTSASCPMFSGVWSIVNQKSGKSAGQAAPLLYSLPSGSVRDVKQTSAYSGTNVAGFVLSTGAPVYYNAAAVVTPDTSTGFTSAFYQGTSGRYYAISFGTDSSLLVTNGWDNGTGVGSPAPGFVDGVISKLP